MFVFGPMAFWPVVRLLTIVRVAMSTPAVLLLNCFMVTTLACYVLLITPALYCCRRKFRLPRDYQIRSTTARFMSNLEREQIWPLC